MTGIQLKRFSDWGSNNVDLLIILVGIMVVLTSKGVGQYDITFDSLSVNIGFWALLAGVVIISIGLAALVCYRVLFKWTKFTN